MTVVLAVLISGVLLDANDKPLPKAYLALTMADGKLIQVITDKNGKFRADLPPGTYRFQWLLFTVGKSTSHLKLKLDKPLPPAQVQPRQVPGPVHQEPPQPQIQYRSLPLGPRA